MRVSWSLALGACALGLATAVRGHLADVACPGAVLEATSEAIGKMTTKYNTSDIGVSLGQDHGGAAGVEEAVAAIRDRGDPSQRSRALQLLRYAFAKHAVAVFREAGEINQDVDAIRAALSALDSEVAECDDADAVTIVPATGVEVAQLSNAKVSFSNEAGVGYTVDAGAIESAATARGQLFQSECIHLKFDGAEQLSAVVVDSLRAAVAAAQEEAAEAETEPANTTEAEPANTTEAEPANTTEAEPANTTEAPAARGQQMQMRQLLAEPQSAETPASAAAAVEGETTAELQADRAGSFDSMQGMQARIAELERSSASLPLQVNAAQLTAQDMVQRAGVAARAQTYMPDGTESAHIRQWETQQHRDMQAGARDLAEASQYGSGTAEDLLAAAQGQSQLPRFRTSRAQGMTASGSTVAGAGANGAVSQTAGLSERDPRFAEVAAAEGAGVSAPPSRHHRAATRGRHHAHQHAGVPQGSQALAAAQRLRMRMRHARSEAMAEAEQEGLAEQEEAEEEEAAEEEEEAQEEAQEEEEEMSEREAAVRRHRFLQRRRFQEEEALEEEAQEQELEQEAELEQGMMGQSQDGMQAENGQGEALLAQDEDMGDEAMSGEEAGMEQGGMQMQEGQEAGMGEMQFRERGARSSGARARHSLRHQRRGEHGRAQGRGQQHASLKRSQRLARGTRQAAAPAMQFREAASASVATTQRKALSGQAQQHQHAASAAQWLANTPTVPGSAPHQIPAPQRAAMGLLARAMSSHPGSLEGVGAKDVPSLAAAASNRVPTAADVRSVKGDQLLSSIMLQTGSAPVTLLMCFNTPSARDQAMCPIRHAALAAHPSLLAGEDGPKSITDHVSDAVETVANTTTSLATEMSVSNATGPSSIRLAIPDSLAPCTLAAYGPIASVVLDTELNQAPPSNQARFLSHSAASSSASNNNNNNNQQQQRQAVSLSSLLRFRQVEATDDENVSSSSASSSSSSSAAAAGEGGEERDEEDPMAEVGAQETSQADDEAVTSTSTTEVQEPNVVSPVVTTGDEYEAVRTVGEIESTDEVVTVPSLREDASKAKQGETEELTDDEREAAENEKRANHAILAAAKHAVQNTTAHHAAHAAAVKNSKKILADASGRNPVMPLNVTTKTVHRVKVRAHPPSPSPAVSPTPSPTPTQLPRRVPVETDESIEQKREGPAQPATLVSSVEQVDEMGLTYQEKSREAEVNPIAPHVAAEAQPKQPVASTKPAPSPVQASPIVVPAATVKPAT